MPESRWLLCERCGLHFAAWVLTQPDETCPRPGCESRTFSPVTLKTVQPFDVDPPLFDHDGAAVEPVDEQLARAKGVRR